MNFTGSDQLGIESIIFKKYQKLSEKIDCKCLRRVSNSRLYNYSLHLLNPNYIHFLQIFYRMLLTNKEFCILTINQDYE